MDAKVTPGPVGVDTSVPKPMGKKATKRQKLRDNEFLMLFDKLMNELAIVAGHERNITTLRERMAEIMRERDA